MCPSRSVSRRAALHVVALLLAVGCSGGGKPSSPPPSPAPVPWSAGAQYTIDQLQLLARGASADFDRDGFAEFHRSVTGGVIESRIDRQGAASAVLTSTWDPAGNLTVASDSAGSGTVDGRTVVRIGPPFQWVQESDTNGNGVVDQRITETYDLVAGTVHVVVETDPTEQGTFTVQDDVVMPAAREAGEPPPCPDDGHRTTDWSANDTVCLLNGVNVCVHTKPDSGCNQATQDAIRSALDCVLNKSTRCLAEMNDDQAAALVQALENVPVHVACGNACPNEQGSTLTDRNDPRQRNISINPDNFLNSPPPGQCSTLLHELLHAGNAPDSGPVKHDDGVDALYRCGRYCAGWKRSQKDCDECAKTAAIRERFCRPKPNATAFGDPHLRTWDGTRFDLQAVGEFILARDGSDFEVQVRQGPYGTSRLVAVNKAVALRVGSDRLMFTPGTPGSLKLNGAEQLQSATIYLPAGEFWWSGQDLEVNWTAGHRVVMRNLQNRVNVQVELPPTGFGPVGLLGDLDGNPANDFRLRDGTVLGPPPLSSSTLYGTFASAWRISQGESLFTYATGESTATYTDLTFPDAVATVGGLSPASYTAARDACAAAGVTDGNLLQSCILDVGVTGDPTFVMDAAAVPTTATACAADCTRTPCGGDDGCGGLCPASASCTCGSAKPADPAPTCAADGTTVTYSFYQCTADAWTLGAPQQGTCAAGSTCQTGCGYARYLGCYADAATHDISSYTYSLAAMTLQTCIARCNNLGYPFAGLEAGVYCRCGNSFGRYGPATSCTTPCGGNSGQTCGGTLAHSVYYTR